MRGDREDPARSSALRRRASDSRNREFGSKVPETRALQGKRFIITPTSKTDPEAIKKVASLWKAGRARGARNGPRSARPYFRFRKPPPSCSRLFPRRYFTLGSLIRKHSSTLPGGVLRDFTRVAASSPGDVGRYIYMPIGKTPLRRSGNLRNLSQKLEAAIEDKDSEALKKLLSKALRARRKVLSNPRSFTPYS